MKYQYRVTRVVRVIDGDTIDVELDLGFYTHIRVRIRLVGIDTPEVYGVNASEEGRRAKEFTEAWLRSAEGLIVRTYKLTETTPVANGGFGRWAGEFFDDNDNNLRDALVDQGLG